MNKRDLLEHILMNIKGEFNLNHSDYVILSKYTIDVLRKELKKVNKDN